jgi:hypothetical protein
MKTGLMKPFITSLVASSVLLLAMFVWGSGTSTQAAHTVQPRNTNAALNAISLAAASAPTTTLTTATVSPTGITTTTMEYSDTTIWCNDTYFTLATTGPMTIGIGLDNKDWVFYGNDIAEETDNGITTRAVSDTGGYTRSFEYHFDTVGVHEFTATVWLTDTTPNSQVVEFEDKLRIQPAEIDIELDTSMEMWLGQGFTPSVVISPSVMGANGRADDKVTLTMGGNDYSSLVSGTNSTEQDGMTYVEMTDTVNTIFTKPGTYTLDAEYMDDDATDKIIAVPLNASKGVNVKAPELQLTVDGKTQMATVSGTVPLSAEITSGEAISPAYVEFEITEGMSIPMLAATDPISEDISGKKEAGTNHTFTAMEGYTRTYTVTANLMSSKFEGEDGDVIATDWMTVTVPPIPDEEPYLDEIMLNHGEETGEKKVNEVFEVTINLEDNEGATWENTTTVELSLTGDAVFTETSLMAEKTVDVVDGDKVYVTSANSETVYLTAQSTNSKDQIVSSNPVTMTFTANPIPPCGDECSEDEINGGQGTITNSDEDGDYFGLEIAASSLPDGTIVRLNSSDQGTMPDGKGKDKGLFFFYIECLNKDTGAAVTPCTVERATVRVRVTKETTSTASLAAAIDPIGSDVYEMNLGLSKSTATYDYTGAGNLQDGWGNLDAEVNTTDGILVSAPIENTTVDHYYSLTDGGPPTVYLPFINR